MSNAKRHGGIGTSAWNTGREFDELQYHRMDSLSKQFPVCWFVQLNIE